MTEIPRNDGHDPHRSPADRAGAPGVESGDSTGSTALFSRGSWAEASRISEVLRSETVGGALLLVATVLAMVWANSPWADAYFHLTELKVGPAALHLDLALRSWAADGLLAIFFFVAGLELKREFVAGDLRDPKRAALPIAAAVGGVILPALIFVAFNLGDDDALQGWAVPTATDIAFALAVLAVVGSHLPSALRTFLLTLAVVDDLIAITIIALFYTDDLHAGYLALALVPLAAFAFLVQRRVRSWYLLLPLAFITWALVHSSGVHATVAGVLLGFAVPVLRRDGNDSKPGLAEHFEHLVRPVSAGVAVPVFAFFSAGVALGGWEGLGASLGDRVALGIIAALVVGKTAGVWLSTFLVAKTTKASLDKHLAWIDVLGISILAGVGFTVSLLIGELAFGVGTERGSNVKVAVLVGSLAAALLASVVLRMRNRHYRILSDAERVDSDNDGIPDVYEGR